ncbi:hypothetical protein COLO4_24483 [Corchorus olitorius]|uniref:Uncharacterized protein n=1 Tax=Corchorus olitorius TaxID=93759 RepID=A0A1R3I9K0_9ROSI|nr:hypothetical protein COLO4_24483 [Corchorus olitorius]
MHVFPRLAFHLHCRFLSGFFFSGQILLFQMKEIDQGR